MNNEFELNAALDEEDAVGAPVIAPARPTITLDVVLYERYLADSGLTDEQKRQFLEALWTIIVGFVDLGFGITPLEQATAVDGFASADESASPDPAEMVGSSDQPDTDTTLSLRAEIDAALRKGRRT